MPFASTHDIETYYEVLGEGPPLLLISGLNCDHAILWKSVKEKLAEDYQVFMYAPRGIVPSSVPHIPYTIEMMADDASALLHHLKISSANVLGYSMGGMIALSLSIRHPDKVDNLVICASSAKISNLNRLVCESYQKILVHNVPTQDAEKVMLPWLFSNTYLTALMENRLTTPMPQLKPLMQQDPLGLLHQFEALASCDMNPHLSEINTPTLIIAGEKDLLMPIEDAQNLEARIPNARLVVIPHAGHLLIHEQPNIFLQMVSAFMKSTL